MSIKYQIFVSSTYSDLKEERDQVIKAILEMGHIPVGMEMFSAGNEEQWQIIQKAIDDSDYYIVICAHRYGSMDGNISYTEKEYDYAVSKNIPTLGFVIDDYVDWDSSKMDDEPEKLKKLIDFKIKIKKKYISTWTNREDLYGKISISLMKQFSTNPRIGWVKADQISDPKVVTELSRLSSENSKLRNEIEYLLKSKKDDDESKLNSILNTIQNNTITLSFYYKYGKNWENSTIVTYYDIFSTVAPELMVESSVSHAATFIGFSLNPDQERSVRSDWPVPSNFVNTIFADFSVLELVQPSDKNHSVKDKEDYWVLTNKGKKLYKLLRKEKLELSTEETKEPTEEANRQTSKKK